MPMHTEATWCGAVGEIRAKIFDTEDEATTTTIGGGVVRPE